MGRKIRTLFWLLAGLFLAYDLYLWGGLALNPTVGQPLRAQASLQSPLAASYLFLGRHAVNAVGRETQAVEFAAKRFPDQIADRESLPQSILSRFLAAQSATGSLAYYGAPFLLVLSLVLHARRQKPIRSFGGKG
jgi:hypothetical protein